MSKSINCLHCHSPIVRQRNMVTRVKVLRHPQHKNLCYVCGHAEAIFIKERDRKKVVQSSLGKFFEVKLE
jgi:RNase P subunit RPR2